MKDNRAIGERLTKARKAAGLSRAEAAASMNINYQTYSAHENGNRGVVRAIERYARKFSVSADWLLTGKGPPPKEREKPDPNLADWQLLVTRAVQDAIDEGADRQAVASFLAGEVARLLAELAHSQGADVQGIVRETIDSPKDSQQSAPIRRLGRQ